MDMSCLENPSISTAQNIRNKEFSKMQNTQSIYDFVSF